MILSYFIESLPIPLDSELYQLNKLFVIVPVFLVHLSFKIIKVCLICVTESTLKFILCQKSILNPFYFVPIQ